MLTKFDYKIIDEPSRITFKDAIMSITMVIHVLYVAGTNSNPVSHERIH